MIALKNTVEELRAWFLDVRREFPWREGVSPYRVWVSEVMLQQTRASVVIPYFLGWMEAFPSVELLAKAGEEEVIKLWEGLGYYSRARSLLKGARVIVQEYGGKIPEEGCELEKIPGIGPYTSGAIRSFAFHQKAAAVDGNVLRVIARYFAIDGVIDKRVTKEKITEKTERLLPDSEPWVIMEALIELGATVCGKKPACAKCPLMDSCRAYAIGATQRYPEKRKPPSITVLERFVPIILHESKVLVQRHVGKKVMSGLYEFPYFPKGDDWEVFYPGKLKQGMPLREVGHTFTRYRAKLYPVVWLPEEKREVEGYLWVAMKDIAKLPFSSGHRKVAEQLREIDENLTH